jgi:hypothetical protein
MRREGPIWAQVRFDNADGYGLTGLATNARAGQCQRLEFVRSAWRVTVRCSQTSLGATLIVRYLALMRAHSCVRLTSGPDTTRPNPTDPRPPPTNR